MPTLGVLKVQTTNDQLLKISYRNPKNIRNFLRNWGELESLSRKGDRVATCILTDFKVVTGIDTENYSRNDRDAFNRGWGKGKLSHNQYMCIAYNLVIGYSQEDIAFIMGVDQSVVCRNINSGIKKIQQELNAFYEERMYEEI